MEEKNFIRIIQYIEEHLKDDSQGVLDNKTLASIAGYSEYHFLRLFHKFVNLTPADYIRKRRISEIVRRIGTSNRAMSDIAFEYGFNSKENFTRAFKKEHRILPSEFRTTNCSLKLFDEFSFDPHDHLPEVSLIYLNGFTLTVYPFEDAFPPNCWNRYNAENRSATLSGGATAEDFGAMIWNSEKGGLDYFIGIRSEDAVGDTKDTVNINIEAGLYAVFKTLPASQHSFVNIIRYTWNWIEWEWLPKSGYVRKGGYELESYVESSKKYSECIYIPIISKNKETDGNKNGRNY